jgi:hypothetical protein
VANLGGSVDNDAGSSIAGSGGTSNTGDATGGNVDGSRSNLDGDFNRDINGDDVADDDFNDRK